MTSSDSLGRLTTEERGGTNEATAIFGNKKGISDANFILNIQGRVFSLSTSISAWTYQVDSVQVVTNGARQARE